MAAAGPAGPGSSVVDLLPFASTLAATWLLDDPTSTHRRVAGTLVSADLSGFTALSERLAERGRRGAEDLTAMVNGCFTALIRAAGADGGDVLKFGGDALLVWFEGDDHARRAVRAATRMQRAIGGVRFRRAGLSMSVGAHTDTFDLFLVGRDDWRELVLAGAPVTATVELEAAASAGEVRVSSAVGALVPAHWTEAVDGATNVVLDAVEGASVRTRAGERPSITDAAAARLVAPTLHENIAALGRTSGEHRLVTVVFAELEGSDASVGADPERFAAGVDALVRSVQELAERYRLLFLYTDVIADGVKLIAVAGAPTSTGEDEEAGLRLATDLVAGDPEHKLRAGVNRGRVFAGFLGSDERRTYTVMGDPVNLAARLMVRAEPGEVLGSDEVVRASRAEFACTPVAPFLVKGKVRPVNAHLVGEPTGSRRETPIGRLPMVGREFELTQLRAAVASVAAGSGQVIEIVGDAGIGKTRLIQEVADDARLLVRVSTECQPYDALTPFAGVRPLLRRALGIPVGATPAECGRALTSLARRVAPAIVPLLPLVAVPLGAEVRPTPEADAVAEEFRQARMHDAAVVLLSAALPSPTLLVVEDVYYVDDSSLRLLRAIATAVPNMPWVLLVTRRPEGPGLIVGEADGTLLKLAPLDDHVVAELATLAVGDPTAAPDLVAIAERAGGNPLFVLELIEAARSGLAPSELPESIERLVATRVDRLEPADRALLRQAAVAGRVFHVGLVNTLFALEGRPVVRPEQWSRLGEFVEPDGARRWRFRHAVFRDVAYEGLPFARRKRMHGSVGELLEAGVAGEPDSAVLSLHFWLAGDASRTWRYSVEAGAQAWSSFALSEAIAAYQRALSVLRRAGVDEAAAGTVAESYGDALERAGRYEEARQGYRAAQRALAGRAGDLARLDRKQGVLDERVGRYGGALRRYRRALARLPEAGPEVDVERADLANAYAGVRHRQGHHRDSLTWARRAEAEATRAGEARSRAHALLLQQLSISHGAGTPSTEPGEEALRLFTELGDVLYQGKVLNNLGIECYYRGRWTEAQARYTAAGEAFARAGDVAEVAAAHNNLAEIQSDQGLYDEAAANLAIALREWRRVRHVYGVGAALANAGRNLARRGEHEAALTDLHEALATFESIGSAGFRADTLTKLAELEILRGEPAAATALLGALEELGRLPSATAVAAARIGAFAALQLDDAAVVDRFEEAIAAARAEDVPFELALSLWGLGQLQRARRDPSAAALAAEADALFERLGVVTRLAIPLPV